MMLVPERDTELLKQLRELAPGETKVLERSDVHDGTEGRFRVMAERGVRMGEIKPDFLNGLEHPPIQNFLQSEKSELRSLSLVKHKVATYTNPKRQPKDFYSFNGTMAICTERFFQCVHGMDPDSIEYIPIDLRNGPNGEQFYLIMFVRSFDPIDLRYSNVEISKYELGKDSNVWVPKLSLPDDGYVVRDDIAPDIHAIVNTFNAQILVSKELVACLRETKCRGVYFYRTESWGKYPHEEL